MNRSAFVIAALLVWLCSAGRDVLAEERPIDTGDVSALSISGNGFEQAPMMLAAGGGRPPPISPKFNRAAKGPSIKGGFNRAARRPSIRPKFNSAARGPRFLRRDGNRSGGIRSNSKLKSRFQEAVARQPRKSPLVFRNKYLSPRFNASASNRVTPPRRVYNALNGNRTKGISSAPPNIKGAKPPGYLTRKFNSGALGVESIRGRFNSAARKKDDHDPPPPPAPVLKPKGPR